jgi:hypothetical protein
VSFWFVVVVIVRKRFFGSLIKHLPVSSFSFDSALLAEFLLRSETSGIATTTTWTLFWRPMTMTTTAELMFQLL